MLTKEQYLYQAKLIIDCFPKEEYEQIPQGILEYIEENMKEDPNIVINPNVSLEEQDIDPQTLKLLKNIINIVDENNFYEEYKKELNEYLENVIEQNRWFEARIDNINLNKNISKLEVENEKIPQAKELVYGYKKVIENKDKEIEELKNECNSLKEMLNKIPKFIKTLFLRNKKVKLLNEKND